MNLTETLYLMVQKSMKAAQLTDLRVGTVTAVGPLEITTDPAMPPIKAGVLYLTEAVIEKKIPILSHAHDVNGLSHSHNITNLGHTHTIAEGSTGVSLGGSYESENALGDVSSASALDGIACYENGQPLPVENGYIILNRALAIGDKVLLLRVLSGQAFVVLSRIFEEVS